MTFEYKSIELFGGAIKAKVPADFGDVSDIRQVPDNQEVYLSTSGFTSLSIDLCERVTTTNTNAAALEFHFSDVVAEGDTKRIFATDSDIELPKFPGTPVNSLMATVTPTPPNASKEPGPNTATYVVVSLALIRLESQMTDMVVALNQPNVPKSQELVKEGEHVDFSSGVLGQAVEGGKEIMNEFLRSLEIVDWDLFGPGG